MHLQNSSALLGMATYVADAESALAWQPVNRMVCKGHMLNVSQAAWQPFQSVSQVDMARSCATCHVDNCFEFHIPKV